MSQSDGTEGQMHISADARRLIVAGLLVIAIAPPALAALTAIALYTGTFQAEPSLLNLVLVWVSVTAISSGFALFLWLKVFERPVSKLSKTEKLYRSAQLRDSLTNLPNRDGLRRVLKAAERGEAKVGLLLIDIDQFRRLNSSLGQPVGDNILCAVADRLRALVRSSDVLARVNGDQFVVAVPDMKNDLGMVVMARNLLRAFQPEYPVGEYETTISFSVGIATTSNGQSDPDTLLNNAESAMRAAKGEGGRCYRIYDPEMDSRLQLAGRLQNALENNEFSLYFQPIVDAVSGDVCTLEALLRWKTDETPYVGPAEFIPILEQTGQIVEVGSWVLEKAVATCSQWLDQYSAEMTLSVNVSPRQFADDQLVDIVTDVLSRHNFPASQLQLEVTEGLLLNPDTSVFEKIESLNSLGVRLALDDFGMGYSSLAYLKRFSLQTIKIDQLFVNDLLTEDRAAAIVRAIVSLGHGLEMHITAEGVETHEQYQQLSSLGVDSLQGYYISRPLTEQGTQEFLARYVALPNRADSGNAHQAFRSDMPLGRRVKVLRNNEVLADTCQAVRRVEYDGSNVSTTLWIPRHDLRVDLRNQETDGADQSGLLDLVGGADQIIASGIANRLNSAAQDDQSAPEQDLIHFDDRLVTIQESPD